MTKHIARSIVAVLILSLIGYVVWFLFFQTKNEDYVSANTVAVVEKIFDKDKGVNAKIKSVDAATSAGKTNQISLSSNTEVMFIRSKANSWNVITDVLSDITKYYYSYSMFANSLSDAQKQQFDLLKSQLVGSSNKLIEKINNLLYYQKNNYILNDNTSSKILAEYYASMMDNKIVYINDLTNFNVFLRDYVVSTVYNDSFVFDFKNIYYNTILNTTPNVVGNKTANGLVEWTSIYDQNNNLYNESFANNVLAQNFISQLKTRYEYKNFTDQAKAEKLFLNLSKNYKQIVFGANSVFRFKHDDIVKIANGVETDKTTTITIKYLPDIVELLNILAYNK